MVMANIYCRCGKYEEALDEIEVLLSVQNSFTVNSANLNAHFDPLRKLPRYQEMMKKYALSPGSL